VTNAVGKPVARCKHQTATLGSNPMLSDNQSFSTLAIMENTPKMGRFRTQTTTRERHGKAERGRFIRLSPGHDGRMVVRDAHFALQP
jgi:hypothetical protein